MDLALPPKLQRWAEAQVKAGRYTTVDEVVADALRRLSEGSTVASGSPTAASDADPDASDGGLVQDALRLAARSQRDALALLQDAASGGDVRQGLAEYTSSVMNNTLDLMRHVPIARDVEQTVRSSLETVSDTSTRSSDQTRVVRQGLEATSAALSALIVVLDTLGTATRPRTDRPPTAS